MLNLLKRLAIGLLGVVLLVIGAVPMYYVFVVHNELAAGLLFSFALTLAFLGGLLIRVARAP